MPLTNAHKRIVNDHQFRTGSWTKPTGLNLGLFTTLPAADGTGGVEVSSTGTGYNRVARNPLDANWNQAVDGIVTNAAAVTFPDPTGNWGVILGIGVWNQAGVLVRFAQLTTPKTVNAGDPGPTFPVGAIQFAIA